MARDPEESEHSDVRRCYWIAGRAALFPISVLLVGETGVGKEVLASFIHRRSRRCAGPLVAINCAALCNTLGLSELFGHEKGAYTGAVGDSIGLLAAAEGGTVFLDEVGELS
jgi:transcriptional regulator with PAS, ATPase and Fis domain